jgi:hypothetical protein
MKACAAVLLLVLVAQTLSLHSLLVLVHPVARPKRPNGAHYTGRAGGHHDTSVKNYVLSTLGFGMLAAFLPTKNYITMTITNEV